MSGARLTPFRPFRAFCAFVGQVPSGAGVLFTDDFADLSIEANATFSRASTAYHQQPDGTYVLCAANEVRYAGARRVSEGVYSALDSEGAALPGPFGLLMEPAATNLVIQSQDFSTGWTLENFLAFDSGSEVNTAAVLAPDGTQTVDKLVTVAATASTRIFRPSATATIGATYIISIFLKQIDANTRWIMLSADANNSYVWFDLTNGVVGSSAGAGYVSHGMESHPNGMYRCWMKWTAQTATSTNMARVATADNNPSSPFPGNGVTGLYVWQAERVLCTSLSSIIPTTTVAVTRAVDALAITGIAADNETRITYTDDTTADLDDWDGTMPTPTEPVVIEDVTVYAPGKRPA